jgi:predicted lipoprotein
VPPFGGVCRAGEVDHARLAQQVIEAHIRPGASAFAEAASILPAAIEALCTSPSERLLTVAQERFASAALALARIDHLRFGALREKSRLERLVLYPDPKGLVRRQVEKALASADSELHSAETLYGKSIALQGFSALELLLYGTDAEKLIASDAAGRFRCDYARAIATNIARIAQDVDNDWRDPTGYAALMLTPGPENPAYLNAGEVTLEVIKSFLDGIVHVREVKLAAPLGMIAPDKAPTMGLFERSGLTLRYLAANLEGLVHLYRKGGLQSLGMAADSVLAVEVEKEIEAARQAANSVRMPIAEARQKPSEKRKLVAMGFPLRNAHGLAIEVLGAATGLSLGFRAGDGD